MIDLFTAATMNGGRTAALAPRAALIENTDGLLSLKA
jgi:hypothetical protein